MSKDNGVAKQVKKREITVVFFDLERKFLPKTMLSIVVVF